MSAKSEIRSSLTLYRPRRGEEQELRPGCPVMVAHDMGRMTDFSQCQRKIKEERPVVTSRGSEHVEEMLGVCGLHVSVYDRAVKKAWAESRAKDDARAKLAKARVAAQRISEALGVEAVVEVVVQQSAPYESFPTGWVRIRIKDLLPETPDG